jgi:co-chaperonin GroES (HSP10)
MATPPVSRGTSYVKNRLRVIAADVLSAGAESVDVSSQYEAKFGDVAVGDKVFFAAYSVNSVGQRSVIFKSSNLVAAIV